MGFQLARLRKADGWVGAVRLERRDAVISVISYEHNNQGPLGAVPLPILRAPDPVRQLHTPAQPAEDAKAQRAKSEERPPGVNGPSPKPSFSVSATRFSHHIPSHSSPTPRRISSTSSYY
jgi:hypothetical protein